MTSVWNIFSQQTSNCIVKSFLYMKKKTCPDFDQVITRRDNITWIKISLLSLQRIAPSSAILQLNKHVWTFWFPSGLEVVQTYWQCYLRSLNSLHLSGFVMWQAIKLFILLGDIRFMINISIVTNAKILLMHIRSCFKCFKRNGEGIHCNL